jgi:outer membrane receptor protein involved in Fe transport
VKSDYPDDHGETTDARLSGGVEMDLDDWGVIKVKRGYRKRNNDFVVGYSPLIAEDDQINEIDEFIKSLNILYDLDLTLFQRRHKLQLGADHQFSDYVRKEAPGGPRVNSQTRQLGFFIHNQWSLSDAFLFQWGYRDNRTRGKFRTDQLVFFDGIQRWVNGETEKTDWHNTAYDLGLTCFLSNTLSFFASYGTTFRTPNTDEITEAEDGLNPQRGMSWDLGVRFKASNRLELSLTLFHTVIEDEIYYSEINRNYENTTLRQGFETDIRWYLSDALYLWGNYSYTAATFEDTGDRIPLVPENKGSAGFDWSMFENLTVSVTGTFVGMRYDGNDLENDRYMSLDPYAVFDGKLTYRRKGFKVFAGVNNMFDELYATYAYSERYYGMPGRNLVAGLEWVF